ncbi:MAG: hypothetical protein ACKOXQ_09845 [Hydrogenophaga sp.]
MHPIPASLRRALALACLVPGLLLGGCASVYLVDNQVQSFASWAPTSGSVGPAAPQVYRFDRLPSQREGAAGTEQDALEDITRSALEGVGWAVAADGSPAPWTVQVSASTLKLPRAPWEEPWSGYPAWGVGSHSTLRGSVVFMRMDIPYHERQVSLIVREVSSGRVVYETRARHDGRWNSSPGLWRAMIDAALRDFPNPPGGPRQVHVEVPR